MNITKIIFLIVEIFSVLTACMEQASTAQKITLRLLPYVGQQPLIFNEYRYSNPGGKGHFKIRDFQFYLSNIRLSAEGHVYRVPDSYHLVRFDNENGFYEIDLTIKEPYPFSQITFGVGVDEKANATILNVGDLDPNSRMAWNWEVGYKFILFEGFLSLSEDTIPLVYHIGFDENYTELSLPLHLADTPHVSIFKVDILSLFNGQGALDLAEIPSVKFDRQDARQIAAGFAHLISTCDASCT
ncbi:hypothetical protein OPS25_00300 [Alteromonas ponticola]|uniref:Copper-binding protein MbnP-like domain-containing protein n=1 Tax=Alteromonas aquimaris TaxID=2998417 RepID=A0ABT3P2E5_9ALTE|nr:MbnP family protein [Alteromonas aquimaris]MCW8106940.1 hypothetical protein [Alteromonas aquimaris]